MKDNKRIKINFLAYIIIPFGINRDEYIRYSKKNSVVSCITEQGSFFKRCTVPLNMFNFISFPEGNYSEQDVNLKSILGSQILLTNISNEANPIVIGVMPKRDQSEFDNLEENVFLLKKITEYSSVSVKGNERLLALNLQNEKEKVKFEVNVQGKTDENKLNFTVNGTQTTTAKKQIVNLNNVFNLIVKNEAIKEQFFNFLYQLEQGLTIKDEFNNAIITNDKSLNLKSEGTINIGNTNLEKSLKGETTVKLIEEILDLISKITTATAIGTQPILNKAEFLALKKRVNKILSEKVTNE